MTDLQDFDLDPARKGRGAPGDESGAPTSPPVVGSPLSLGPMLAGIALAVALAALALYAFRTPGCLGPKRQPTPPALAAVASPDPSGPKVALPALDASDDFMRELIRGLSSHPKLAAFLAARGLVRTFVASVQNVSEGRSPAPLLRSLTPDQPFRAVQKGARLSPDPRSYAAYDDLADAVASLDAAHAVSAYRTVMPLIDAAYRELGFPDVSFSKTLEEAVDVLLKTPVIDAGVTLKKRQTFYEYADPALEGLCLAQKQLLRMGPRNVKLLQAKLREIGKELGMRAAQ
jgi:hypothetical protein